MRRIPSLLTVFLVTFASKGFCASKLLSGYYVSQAGDTVSCKIVYGDWSLNPRAITVETSGARQSFGVHDIRAFGVHGYGDYRSIAVKYHNNPISGSNLPEEFSDKLDSGTYFLRIITSGYYSLFELNFSHRSYYFLSEKDSGLNELVYRVKQTDAGQTEDPQYKKTIFALFSKEGNSADYFETIEHTFYSASDLKPLISRLNKYHAGPEKISARLPVNRFELDFYGGINVHSFPSSLDGSYSTGNKISPSLSAAGGINFLYRIPSRFNSFAIGFSLGYDHYSFTADRSGTVKFYQSANYNGTTDYSEHIHSSNTMILGNLYISYIFNPLSQLNFYAKAGFGASLSIRQDRDIYSTYNYTSETVVNGLPPAPGAGNGTNLLIPVRNILPAFNADAGMAFGRSKIELAYYLPVELSSSSYHSFRMGMIGLSYFFAILK